MKLYKKIAGLMMAGVMAVSGLSASLPAMTAQAADDTNDDWLHAVGSKLYDKDGNQVWLTGANWFGFNCTENFPHGLWSADADALLSTVADHGVNCIRFPVSTELLVSWMNGTPLEPVGLNASNNPDYMFNPDFCDADGNTMDSMGIFDVLMQKMKKYGIKAIIDVHSPASHNSGHNYNLWYYEASAADADNMAVAADGTQMTTEMWVDSLVWLADKYKNDDTIIAYDLKNEPHGKRGYDGTTCPSDIAKWDGSTDENNWAYAATECGKAILEVNPNALILIEGVEQYPKTEQGYTYDTADLWNAPASQSPWHGAWWGGNLRGVRDYPVDFGSDTLNSQIVYSPHDYGPSVYNQTWFDKDFTTQTLLDDYWYDTWAYINEEDIAPLLIGEWGGHMDGDKNQKWMELLRDYMIENHINHTFWCLNPNSGDTGGLLDHSFSVWDEEKYALFELSLWQTQETGKYIGLDHQHPLGVNGTGLSLSEFYSSYSSTEGSNINGGTIVNGNDPTDPTEPTDPPVTVYGDVTSDSKVTLNDLVKVAKYITQASKSAIDKSAADVNADSKLNVYDMTLYKQYLNGTITKFPAEE
ncbi:MAG: cellulase family glycosylhydrolase [Ruminococcus sp.]|nr:cellulase family glycosylhydrolase [Ruminococcus sp.]